MGRPFHFGVDTGGTFTDFVVLDAASGALQTFKLPSTPDEPAAAVRAGLERARERLGVAPGDIGRFVFGTTVATNAVLERRGARVVLVTTRGASSAPSALAPTAPRCARWTTPRRRAWPGRWPSWRPSPSPSACCSPSSTPPTSGACERPCRRACPAST